MKRVEQYQGFELGPIRPPSEAGSLLLRVTRNCPWNRCRFCALYKGEQFTLRPVEDVIEDINQIKRFVDLIGESFSQPKGGGVQRLARVISTLDPGDMMALQMAYNWMRSGMASVFLQDANTLIVKPGNLLRILNHIKSTFPGVTRITSYARSKTLVRIDDEALQRLADAGLNRIHIGVESGCDSVLQLMDKGVDKAGHIIAGKKVKRAGVELSVYYMPGLGGEELSRENALETADAVNQMDPEYIRIRSLAIPAETELHRLVEAGVFKPLGDRKTVAELLLFIEHLEGIASTIKSDHILNLLQEVTGRLPAEREAIMDPLKRFLAMSEREQIIFMVGRRSGIFRSLEEVKDTRLWGQAEQRVTTNSVTAENVDEFTAQMVSRFI